MVQDLKLKTEESWHSKFLWNKTRISKRRILKSIHVNFVFVFHRSWYLYKVYFITPSRLHYHTKIDVTDPARVVYTIISLTWNCFPVIWRYFYSKLTKWNSLFDVWQDLSKGYVGFEKLLIDVVTIKENTDFYYYLLFLQFEILRTF